MGMGYFAFRALVMTPDNVKKICTKEFEALEKVLEQGGNSLEDFAKAERVEDASDMDLPKDEQLDEYWKRLEAAHKTLKAAFEKKTRVHGKGLTIALSHHDPDEGQRYDSEEIDGAFFYVEGVESKTPAGKKFDKFVTDARWTEFG